MKEESQILLPAIFSRMNNIPYAETCKQNHINLNLYLLAEEVRVNLIDLLVTCLESDKYLFLPKLGEVCSMIAKAL